MNVLLDIHAIIWYYEANPRLSVIARSPSTIRLTQVGQPREFLGDSHQAQIGKTGDHLDVSTSFNMPILDNGFVIRARWSFATRQSLSFASSTIRDPFDRMLEFAGHRREHASHQQRSHARRLSHPPHLVSPHQFREDQGTCRVIFEYYFVCWNALITAARVLCDLGYPTYPQQSMRARIPVLNPSRSHVPVDLGHFSPSRRAVTVLPSRRPDAESIPSHPVDYPSQLVLHHNQERFARPLPIRRACTETPQCSPASRHDSASSNSKPAKFRPSRSWSITRSTSPTAAAASSRTTRTPRPP